MSIKKTQSELLKRSFVEMMKDVGTAIPGHFLAFDPLTQLAQIQIGIQRIDISGKAFEPSPIIQCPVAFIGGGSYFIEHQIDVGDECLIIFSQRCIDGWVNTGGVANNPIMRFHDFSDAAILPGLRSQPNTISDFQNNGIRLRDKEGLNYIWLKNDGSLDITTTVSVNINGVMIDPTGNIVAGNIESGSISATSLDAPSVKAGGQEMAGHAHLPGTYLGYLATPIQGISGAPTP